MKKSAFLLALLPAVLSADDIYLKGGGQVTGEIVERSAATVTVDIGAGSVKVPMASVVRIATGMSPLQEVRARAAKIRPGDAAGWRDLGNLAASHGLATQSRDAYSRALAIDPADPVANRALGRVEVKGRWMSEEEGYRARGYVEFEGAWVTPAERAAIARERQALEAADREALAQQLQAEVARQKQKDAEAAARKAAWDQNWPMLGDPVFLNWAPGQTNWPAQPVQPAPPPPPAPPAPPEQ